MSLSVLLLFTTGDAPRSRQARAALESASSTLPGDTAFEEIDLLSEPSRLPSRELASFPALVHINANGDKAACFKPWDSNQVEAFLAQRLKPALEDGDPAPTRQARASGRHCS